MVAFGTASEQATPGLGYNEWLNGPQFGMPYDQAVLHDLITRAAKDADARRQTGQASRRAAVLQEGGRCCWHAYLPCMVADVLLLLPLLLQMLPPEPAANGNDMLMQLMAELQALRNQVRQ